MPRQEQPSADLNLSVSGSENPARRPGGVVVRLGWMLGGTLALLVTVMKIASQPPWTIGLLDLVFWGAVALTVMLRYWDITRFRGETTSGEPATMADFRRYAAGTAGVSAACWLIARAIQL